MQRDPKLLEATFKIGRKVAAVCDNCHGANGNSPQPDTPNLAAQNAAYHLDQLHAYAVGKRKEKGGFYVGNGAALAHYPMPSHDVLRGDFSAWWRSANV